MTLSPQTVAFSMSSGQIAQMREEFNLMDKDRSGTISMMELRSALARLYVPPPPLFCDLCLQWRES
jgi:Ca2+-binding EF-hand superfamily protein